MSRRGVDAELEFFHDVLEQQPEERRGYIARRHGHEPTIVSRLERLLDAHERAHPVTKPFVGRESENIGVQDLPDRIGGYRILELIGEGGMGVVYAAEQAEPIQRKVALKVIKPGMDSASVLKRFEFERQALARMDHPNIALVFDGGVIGEGEPGAGRPFFVMEHVPGPPITEFARRRRLGVEARIELLMQACAAAQHAHTKGVIHRDLKPSNVLVTEIDGAAVCKVIDFGIAKAVLGSGVDAPAVTSPGAPIGTPQYMSPEQSRGSADVDTRSDVYALGVILYELLTDAPIFETSAPPGAGIDAVRRAIEQVEPASPSSRIMRTARTAGGGGAPTDPDRARRVRGDLDWITMRAIAKDADRRYPTVAALGDDLRRFLRSEPVDAGPPSAFYRVSKFVVRNQTGVAAAMVSLLLLIGGLAGTSYGLIEARRATSLADERAVEAKAAQAAAEHEAATARAINEFLNDDLLSAVDPGRNNPRDVTVREVLGAAADRIEGRFADRPLVEAEIRRTLGRTFEQLGMLDEAGRHFERSLELFDRELHSSSHDAVNALQSLATNLMNRSRFAEAIGLTKRQIAILEDGGQPDENGLLRAKSNLAVALLQIGRIDEAIAPLKETLAGKRRLLGDLDQSTLTSVHNLSGLYVTLQRFDDAVELALEAYEGRRGVLGPGDPRTLRSQSMYGWCLQSLGRLDEAAAVYADAVATADERLGEEHPTTLHVLSAQARLMIAQGDADAGAAVLRRVYEAQRRLVGDRHHQTLSTAGGLGDALLSAGREAEAVEFLSSIVDQPAAGTEFEIDLALLYAQLGTARMRLDQRAGAAEAMERAYATYAEVFGPGDPRTARLAGRLAELYDAWAGAELDPTFAERASSWRDRAAGDAPPPVQSIPAEDGASGADQISR